VSKNILITYACKYVCDKRPIVEQICIVETEVDKHLKKWFYCSFNFV